MTMALQEKLLSQGFPTSYSIVMKLSKMLLQFFNLYFAQDEYCFNYEQKAAVKMKRVVISSCFLWKLLLFMNDINWVKSQCRFLKQFISNNLFLLKY